MDLQHLSEADLKEMMEERKWQLKIESAKIRSWFSEDRPYAAIIEYNTNDLYDELIDDISWIEDEILTRECESMLR